MRCLLWTCHTVEALRDHFDDDLYDVIQGAWASDCFHFWRNNIWKAKLCEWRNPHNQRDVGEFLRFLLDKCPSLQLGFQFRWEARRVHGPGLDEVRILDAASSVLLVLDSNIRGMDDGLLERVTHPATYS